MRIGLFGHSPLNFVTDICNTLVQQGHEVVVFSFTDKVILDDVNFDFEVVNVDAIMKSSGWKLIHFILGFFYFNFSLLSIDYKEEIFSFKDFYQFVYCYKVRKKMMSLDCCNFQSLTMSNIWSLYLKEDCKIIASFWGSDLNCNDIASTKKNKQRIVAKSDIVTMQSSELEAVFHQKYKKEQDTSIEKTLFPVRNLFFKLADECTKEKSNYSTIAIGYNGFPNQNHLHCIEALAQLPASQKDRILLKVSLHYGGSKEYHSSIIEKLDQSGIRYKINRDRLSLENLVQEKVNTDIFLILPTNDGFSASVSEALYTGGIVITGGWLPYSRYKTNELEIQWLDDFKNLNKLIHSVLNNQETLSMRSASNKEKVMKTLDYDGNLNRWVEILS